MKIVKYVCEGEMMPRGYGLSYRRYDCNKSICHPIPINLVVRLFRALYWRLQFGSMPTKREKRESKIYAWGIAEGRRRRSRER